MREGTTSRVMAANMPYGEFYDFCSVSPEYFGYTLVDEKAYKFLSKNPEERKLLCKI
jgi:hypothetical protein